MIHIGRAGQRLGVFTEPAVRAGIATGRFVLTDLGWREGMEDWKPLSQFDELQEAPPLHEDELEIPIPPSPQEEGLPWDQRREFGRIISFARTARMVMANPTLAFSRMRTDGPLRGPLLFNAIGCWIGLVANATYVLANVATYQPLANPTPLQKLVESAMTMRTATAQLIIFILFGPLIATIGAFALSGILHLLLMLCGGANQKAGVTLRVFCYALGATELFQILPVCGFPVAFCWLLICSAVGLMMAHKTSGLRASISIVMFLGIFVFCLFGSALIVLMNATGGDPERLRALTQP